MESAHALNLFTKYSFCKQPISHQSKYFDQLIYKWLLYGNLNCSFHWMFSLIVRWGIKSPVGELLSVHGWIWRMKKYDMTPPSLSVFLVVYFFWHWILRVDTREFKISRHQCLGKFHLKKEITICPNNFIGGSRYLQFLMVQDLPPNKTCDCSIEFQVKMWLNGNQGFCSKNT